MESAAIAPSTVGFRTIERPEIPSLAWLFSFDEDEPTLVHGSNVDIFPQGFFEGCFAGEFGSDPRLPTNVFGSGMWHADEAWHVITPSHTLEAAFVLHQQGVRGVSNSLAFLVEHFALTPPLEFGYGARLGSAMLGIDKYDQMVFTSASGTVKRYMYRNLVINRSGRYAERRKPVDPSFENYDEYIAYVRSTLQATFANATDPSRHVQYTPIGTMSSGYDSSAVTALAQEFGCRHAVTLRQSTRGCEDSGRSIADALGIAIREFDRADVQSAGLAELAEFFASGLGGDDFPLSVFESEIRNSVLITGTYGGPVWAFNEGPGYDLGRHDNSGATLQDYRLRVGFLHIPVPAIGAMHAKVLKAIGRSEEMLPFSVGGSYDRPIPRRILEERGVSRDSFGTRNLGAISYFSLGNRLPNQSNKRERLSIDARLKLEEFSTALSVDSSSTSLNLRVASWYMRQVATFASAEIVSRSEWLRSRYLHGIQGKFALNAQGHPMSSIMFLACLDQLRARYGSQNS